MGWILTAPAARACGVIVFVERARSMAPRWGQAFAKVSPISKTTAEISLGLMSEHFHQRDDRWGPQKHSRGWWPCLRGRIPAAAGGLPQPRLQRSKCLSREIFCIAANKRNLAA